MSRSGHVCSVDVGTSAVRASLVSSDGTELRRARRARAATEGSVDFDADLLWDDVATVLHELELRETDTVALGIAAHIGTVLLDGAEHPIGRGVGWASTLGADLLPKIWTDVDAALRIGGRPAPTGGAAAYLSWLKANRPGDHHRVRWVLSPKDDLIRRLSGAIATDATNAAYTLASNVRERQWSEQLVLATGVDVGCFPPQFAGTDLVGTVDDAVADRLRLPKGLRVVAGGPDGTVGTVAVAGVQPGVVVDVAGTTDVITRVVHDPDDPVTRHTVTNPYVVADLWSCGGPTGLTGGAVAHLTNLFSLGDLAEAVARLSPALESLAPGCDGLFVLPFFTGSRFPDWRATERGGIWGMTDKHGPAHIVRAAQEAAAFGVRSGLTNLAADQPDAPVILAGGTARSSSLAQLRADVLGRPVLACSDPDVTLRGAAMLACVGSGVHATLADASAAMTPALHSYLPDPERMLAYEHLFEEWCHVRERFAHREAIAYGDAPKD